MQWHMRNLWLLSNAGGLEDRRVDVHAQDVEKQIAEVKEYLHDKRNPKFGVDLGFHN